MPSLGQDSCPYGTHTVDLRLGSELKIPVAGSFQLDVNQPGNLAESLRRSSDTVTLDSDTTFSLKPQEFLLATTLERVELPVPETGDVCLAARIEGKSSRARCGILVHFTAPTVHPGFAGTLTLEIINLHPVPFILRRGMPIAQLIVEEVRGLPVSNPSQFQG